jgi:RNA polymerase sigma-70 factor (ECF subfamily)
LALSLLDKLRKGDPVAFKTLFERHWEQAYAVCYQGTGSRDQAKEMTQEIFKSLWERREALDIDVPLEHYLRRAAKYRVLNFHRDRIARGRLLEARAEEPASPQESVEDRLDRARLAQRAKLLLENFPHRSRDVFRMAHEEELSHADIARTLDISIKTVEYHARSARERLKRELSEEFHP